MVNTNGLNEAYKRKQAGTANQTDLANLDYATKNGWSANPQPNAPNTPLNPSINNNSNSTTLSLGLKTPDVIGNLPSDNTKANLTYVDDTLKQSQDQVKKLQSELDKYQSTQEQNLKAQKDQVIQDQNNIAIDSTKQMTDFNKQLEPLRNNVINFANKSIETATAQNAKDLTNTRINLANETVNYANLLKSALNDQSSQRGLASINEANRTKLINDYQTKININNAAISALDGNINLASDILSKASTSLQSSINNQISFQTMVNGLFNNKSQVIKDNLAELNKQLENIETNKKTIVSIMESSPIVANKANLLLTDTPEQTATKLQSFYVNNPQYTPDNQALIKKAQEKYFDAGITTNDTLETVKSKISASQIYQRENDKSQSRNIQKIGVDENNNDVYGYYDLATNSIIRVNAFNQNNNSQGVVSDPTGNSYNISSYATDPNHETAVQNIVNGMGQFKSVSDIDNYIKSKFPNSPITGQMIYNAAEKYGVSWEVMTAIMAQDSSLGTAGKGARTFNPGNVGNDDSGNIKNYGNWQSGVDAVAQWLGGHKTNIQNNTSSDFTAGQGYNQKQWDTAKSMMSPGSTLTLEGIKQADRPGVNIALNKLKEQAKQSGDIYGVMKASAGGAKIDATTVKDLAKFGTSITQLDSLKKEIDAFRAKGGTGAFKGRINEQKFWDADVVTIRAKLQGVIPTIARGVFSEVGVLTDQDIENYKNTIPNIKTPDEAINRIFEGLMETIDSKILNTYEAYANAGYDVSGFADTYKFLKTKIDNSKYPAGTIVSVNGKKYKSLGNGQFDEIK